MLLLGVHKRMRDPHLCSWEMESGTEIYLHLLVFDFRSRLILDYKNAPSFPGLTSNGVDLTRLYKKCFGASVLKLILEKFDSGSRFQITDTEDVFTVFGQTSRVSYSQQDEKS
jgi:hypothetical protein